MTTPMQHFTAGSCKMARRRQWHIDRSHHKHWISSVCTTWLARNRSPPFPARRRRCYHVRFVPIKEQSSQRRPHHASYRAATGRDKIWRKGRNHCHPVPSSGQSTSSGFRSSKSDVLPPRPQQSLPTTPRILRLCGILCPTERR